MIGQLSRHTPVIVQGATGRSGSVHVRRMIDFGTNIVAGVSARAAGSRVEGRPVFADCRAAVAATGAQVSVAMVPAAMASSAAASTPSGGTIATDTCAPVAATAARQSANTGRPSTRLPAARADTPATMLVPKSIMRRTCSCRSGRWRLAR